MIDTITNIAIEDYLAALMPPRTGALAELEQRAAQQGLALVGPVQGQLLYILARTMGARQALEVGTTTGYAAIWILQALQPVGGHLTVIESESRRYQLAHEFFDKAHASNDVTLHQGQWNDILPRLNLASYDLIFLDILRSLTADDQALQALHMCVALLRPGGLLIGDNVLCSAQVLEDQPPPTVRGIQLFNQALMRHPELESTIVPLRDGVSISRKKDA